MSDFQRRVTLGYGIVLFATFALATAYGLYAGVDLAAVLDDLVATGTIVLAVGLVLLASLAFVVAGLREELSIAGRTTAWWETSAMGFVLLGAGLALSAPHSHRSWSSFGFLLNVAAGLSLALVGYSQLRNGPPTDEDEDLSMRRVATIVIGGTAMVVLFVVVLLVVL